jgi:hypothetical protein
MKGNNLLEIDINKGFNFLEKIFFKKKNFENR